MQKKHDGRKATIYRLAWGLFALLAASSGTGCTALQGVNDYLAYNDTVNDFVLGWRNNVWARQAWHERQAEFYGQPQFAAFGAGFRAGYVSVASGGNGCPPALPPRHYWTWKYQTPEGQAQVAAWFSGFPYGAKAAEEDGAGLYQQIQISHELERQYSPEYMGEAVPSTTPPGEMPAGSEVIPGPDGPQAVPLYDPQSRVERGWPAYTEPMMPVAAARAGTPPSPTSGVVPATYQEPSQLPSTTAGPSSAPVRSPTPGVAPELRGSSWSLSR